MERLVVLARKEKACCAFFEFRFDIGADATTLVVEVPGGAETVLREFARWADDSRPPEASAGPWSARPETAEADHADAGRPGPEGIRTVESVGRSEEAAQEPLGEGELLSRHGPVTTGMDVQPLVPAPNRRVRTV